LNILSLFREKLWSKFGVLFLYQILGFASAFIINIVLARTLSVSEFGQYHYIVTVIVLIAHSFNSALLSKNTREVAKDSNNIPVVLSQSLYVLAIGVVIFLLVSAYIFWSEGYSLLLFICSLSIFTIQVLQIVNISILRGLKKNKLSELPETVLQKMFFLVLIFILAFYTIDVFSAILILLASYFLSFLISLFFLLRNNKFSKKKLINSLGTRLSIWGYFPFLVSGSVSIINNNIDIILLGTLGGETGVAFYKVAVQGSKILVFFLSATNIVLAPLFVEWFQDNNLRKIEEVGSKVSKYLTLIIIPILIGYYLVGEYFLEIVFGTEYLKSYLPLIILSITQLISTAIGSVGVLLNMSNNEKINMYIVAFSATINIILNFFLIPSYGAVGAAIASMTGILLGGLLATIIIYKKYRIVLSYPLKILKYF